jgi:signal transduction histidine kinase/ActR/RegA family two-component response regulator
MSPRGNFWRLRPAYVVPLIVVAAAVPVVGWPLPALWLAIMAGLLFAECSATRRPGVVWRHMRDWATMLTSGGYGVASCYLVSIPNGPLHVFSTTLFGLIMFKILVSDYRSPRRLLINLAPMIAAIALTQVLAIVHYLEAGDQPIVLTILASPALVALLFLTLQRDLAENWRRIIEGRKAAEAAATAKAEFLANMSHEIRTPLTGILGFSSLLNGNPDLPPSARTHVQRILTSGAGLLVVVNDILDFSKLEAGRLQLDPHPVEIRSFFNETLALFEAQAFAKGLALTMEVSPTVPPVLQADAPRLRQILVNLISNAVKFTSKGSVHVSVAFDAAVDVLSVSVADTGEGVAAEKLESVFARFTQADGAVSRRHGGTGLGLSICRGLVDLMGGEVRAVSEIGVGSTFSFTIQAPVGETADQAVLDAAPPDQGETAPQTILVVDDLEVNRELIRVLLEAMGHQVVEASGGEEALRLTAATPFDIILMDLQMPGLDGFETARRIRRSNSVNAGAPIIALSANVLAEHVRASDAAGMDGHLAKPIVVQALAEMIARWSRPAAVSERLRAPALGTALA